jgi:hypothetical protein
LSKRLKFLCTLLLGFHQLSCQGFKLWRYITCKSLPSPNHFVMGRSVCRHFFWHLNLVQKFYLRISHLRRVQNFLLLSQIVINKRIFLFHSRHRFVIPFIKTLIWQWTCYTCRSPSCHSIKCTNDVIDFGDLTTLVFKEAKIFQYS